MFTGTITEVPSKIPSVGDVSFPVDKHYTEVLGESVVCCVVTYFVLICRRNNKLI